MANYYYPLTKKQLVKRYKPLFDIIKRRQSGCFIGFPQSAKSGYLKFLFEEKKILKSLLNKYKTTHKILFFEPVPFDSKNQFHWLYQLSVKLEELDSKYTHPNTHDPVIILSEVQKYILKLSKEKKHMTFILSRPFVWEKLSKEAGYALKAIWDTARKPPNNPCSLIFLLHSKSPINEPFAEFYEPLKIALNENVLHFPVLGFNETSYTVKRFTDYYNLKIDRKLMERIYDVTGGYYPLVSSVMKICKSFKSKINLSTIKSLANHKLVIKEIQNLWDSLSDKQKVQTERVAKGINSLSMRGSTLQELGIIQKGIITSKWVKAFIIERKFKANSVNKLLSISKVLKGKEFTVYKEMVNRNGEVITREEIAEILWGKNAKDRYSNWAIDKTVSRIRKKLEKNNTACSIVTIKKTRLCIVNMNERALTTSRADVVDEVGVLTLPTAEVNLSPISAGEKLRREGIYTYEDLGLLHEEHLLLQRVRRGILQYLSKEHILPSVFLTGRTAQQAAIKASSADRDLDMIVAGISQSQLISKPMIEKLLGELSPEYVIIPGRCTEPERLVFNVMRVSDWFHAGDILTAPSSDVNAVYTPVQALQRLANGVVAYELLQDGKYQLVSAYTNGIEAVRNGASFTLPMPELDVRQGSISSILRFFEEVIRHPDYQVTQEAVNRIHKWIYDFDRQRLSSEKELTLSKSIDRKLKDGFTLARELGQEELYFQHLVNSGIFNVLFKIAWPCVSSHVFRPKPEIGLSMFEYLQKEGFSYQNFMQAMKIFMNDSVVGQLVELACCQLEKEIKIEWEEVSREKFIGYFTQWVTAENINLSPFHYALFDLLGFETTVEAICFLHQFNVRGFMIQPTSFAANCSVERLLLTQEIPFGVISGDEKDARQVTVYDMLPDEVPLVEWESSTDIKERAQYAMWYVLGSFLEMLTLEEMLEREITLRMRKGQNLTMLPYGFLGGMYIATNASIRFRLATGQIINDLRVALEADRKLIGERHETFFRFHLFWSLDEGDISDIEYQIVGNLFQRIYSQYQTIFPERIR